MDRVSVVVHGAMGKMGQEVLKAVHHDPELDLVAGVDSRAENIELSLPDNSGSIPLSSSLESILQRHHPNVLVDFSTAEATMPAVRTAVQHGLALVIGTTGLHDSDLNEIRDLCQSKGTGAVVAPNFALAGVLMIHLAGIAARFFDHAEIIEMHHDQKLDAPSGTAVATAREMVESRGRPFWNGCGHSQGDGRVPGKTLFPPRSRFREHRRDTGRGARGNRHPQRADAGHARASGDHLRGARADIENKA